MKVKIKQLKKGIPVGTKVPVKQFAGNVGRWSEDVLTSNGHQINKGRGADMPRADLEVKTRKIESKSPHTIAATSVDDAMKTDYFTSEVCKKFQQQYRVHYSDTDSVVVSERVFDFSDPYIQEKLNEGYKIIQEEFIKGNRSSYIAGNGWIHAQRTKNSKSYQFRVPDNAMKKCETIATNEFRNIFSYE